MFDSMGLEVTETSSLDIFSQNLQSTQNINLMFSHLIIGNARIYSSILPFAFLTMHDRAAKVYGSVNFLLIQVAWKENTSLKS